MSLFNIKITGRKAAEEKDWKISYVNKSQKEKTCSHCGAKRAVGDNGTTFNKIYKYADGNKTYKTYHTCGHKQSPCTQAVAALLNVTLP